MLLYFKQILLYFKQISFYFKLMLLFYKQLLLYFKQILLCLNKYYFVETHTEHEHYASLSKFPKGRVGEWEEGNLQKTIIKVWKVS